MKLDSLQNAVLGLKEHPDYRATGTATVNNYIDEVFLMLNKTWAKTEGAASYIRERGFNPQRLADAVILLSKDGHYHYHIHFEKSGSPTAMVLVDAACSALKKILDAELDNPVSAQEFEGMLQNAVHSEYFPKLIEEKFNLALSDLGYRQGIRD